MVGLINVPLNFDRQIAISQPARTNKTQHSSRRLFCPTVQNRELLLTEEREREREREREMRSANVEHTLVGVVLTVPSGSMLIKLCQ